MSGHHVAIGITASSAIVLAALGIDGLALGEGIAIAIAIVSASAAATYATSLQPKARSAKVAAAVGALRGRLGSAISGAHENRRAAEDSQRDKEEFLAAVSHELRTPLNSIQGFAQVLVSEIDGPLSASQREDVDAIAQAGTFLKELIDEVIDASSRRTPAAARLEEIDVVDVVRDVARLIEGQRRGKKIAIEIDVAPGLPKISVDPRRIRQILVNLATNAMKFTREGSVRFVVRADGTSMRVSVSDTGVGIPPSELDRIFRAFERVDTNRGRTEGWGLGLAIAREMAQWHAGQIEVESTVGTGSTFTLVLPIGARS